MIMLILVRFATGGAVIREKYTRYTNYADVPRSILGGSVHGDGSQVPINATSYSTTRMYHTCMVLRAAAAGFKRSTHVSLLVAATGAGRSERRQDCWPIISIL